MRVLKVSILLMLSATILAEESTIETHGTKNNSTAPKLTLKKSEPYEKSSEETTFFSKLKNWIFPGNNITPIPDSKAVAGHHSAPVYLAPPRPIHPNRPDCDPCNKEPWIPIATNYGQSTLIGFVPQSAVNTLNDGPHQQYGIPQIPRENYGLPPQSIVTQSFVSPIAQNLILIPPAPVQTFIQPVPNQNYGPPPQLASPPQLGPPPQLGLPAQSGLPPQRGPPRQVGHPSQLGPPSQLGAPPQLGPPPQRGPPRQVGHPSQLGPLSQHGPSSQLGHQSHLGYGPHNALLNKGYLPSRQNFPSIPSTFFSPPPNLYGSPKQTPQYMPPRFVPKLKPNSFGGNFNIPFGMKPPLPNSYVTNYGVPPTSQIPFATYGPPAPTYGVPPEGHTLPQPGPSDSYGAPVTGSNVQYALGVQSGKEYLPPVPAHNVGIATPLVKLAEFDEILQVPDPPRLPIPLPNLNQYPMAPLRAPQDFLTEYHVDGQESRHNEVVNTNHIPNTQLLNNQNPNTHIRNNYLSNDQFLNNNQKSKDHIFEQQKVVNKQYAQSSVSDVQIIPSISVANYLSSIEYPINLIQSPLVDVAVKPPADNEEATHSDGYKPPLKLSQNPIVVDTNYDNYPSSSLHNISYENFKRHNDKDVQSSFSNEVTEILPHPNDINGLATTKATDKPNTLPPVEYSNWSSITTNFISTSMVPPTPGPSTWLTSSGIGQELYTTTSKPKQIQIIIPYTKQTLKGRKVPPYPKEYDNKLSLYTLPPITESEWLKYSEAPTVKPEVINIKDFLKKEEEENFLPYDILNFQKNIDDWTALEYSKNGFHEFKKLTTSSQNQSSKEIPKHFFITKAYDKPTTPKFFDHEAAGSIQKENQVGSFDNLKTNFILEESTLPTTITEEITTTTEVPTEVTNEVPNTNIITTEDTKMGWNEVSPQKEKVYVVTPESLVKTTTPHSTIAFSNPPKIGWKTAKHIKDEYNDDLRLILSEWPHLINNLETTTNKLTTPHPLFGLMGISSYITPKNATVETYSGHSKVITVVTPISVPKNDSRLETITDSSKT